MVARGLLPPVEPGVAHAVGLAVGDDRFPAQRRTLVAGAQPERVAKAVSARARKMLKLSALIWIFRSLGKRSEIARPGRTRSISAQSGMNCGPDQHRVK